jgi:hypothetical protein
MAIFGMRSGRQELILLMFGSKSGAGKSKEI